MTLKESLENAKENAKERNFTQSVDLCINLKGIDLSKPENRFSSEVVLPNTKGKEMNICIIADSTLPKAKKLDVNVLSKKDLENLKDNDKKKKQLVKENDIFLAEASLMPSIGKILGKILGPRGLMPTPYSPDANLNELVEKAKRTCSIKVGKEKTFQCLVGNESMNEEEVEENIKTILKTFEENLPKGKGQIGSVYVKLTMGPSVKINKF